MPIIDAHTHLGPASPAFNECGGTRPVRRPPGPSSGTGSSALVVCAVLAVLTLLASDAPSVVIAGFCVGLAVLFTVWTGLPERRAWRARASTIDDALKVNRARVTRIASDRVVEIQEVEDEGACFAFDAGSGRTIVVARQECYSDETFANSDFSILEVLGWAGAVDVIVTRAGHKVEPERRVSAERKRTLDLPEHLEIVDVPIDQIGL